MTQQQFQCKKQGWSALFTEPMDALLQRYNASVYFDQRLWKVDIAGSLAHAQMLAEQNIIRQEDWLAIQKGLQQIQQEIVDKQFNWSIELEDVHLNIEARLIEIIGDAGKKLHTGRSRNDQVATDIRLWLRDEIDTILQLLQDLQHVLVEQAEQHIHTIMPGFTHLQVAQPVSFAHHLLAYVEMFLRDQERLQDVRKRVNQLPLGAAALAGTSYPLNRHRVAELLHFEGICQNSLDAVSDRDFAIEFNAAASVIMLHISRLSEELILWMNQSFGFIRLPDRFTTGSSIMPQKKNPDIPELARGKTARVVGNLMSLMTLIKAQPLAYNKDNQEDKEPLFDSVDTINNTLHIFVQMIGGLQVNKDRMRKATTLGFATATDLADYLVNKGIPFRDAHEVVAATVKQAIEQGVDLADLSLKDLKTFCPVITEDIYDKLTLEGALNSRNTLGGTAPDQVEKQIAQHRGRFSMA
jgi:argininosuccinate lyase